MAPARAASSPYGIQRTSTPNGPNGVLIDSLPVMLSEPIVRPWKLPIAATNGLSVPRARRTSLMAASLASAPELQKNTRACPSALSRPSSRSASRTPGSCTNRFEVCASLPTWADTASTMAGWAWPSALTAMPAIRSRYWLPSASQTRQPSPRASASGGVP